MLAVIRTGGKQYKVAEGDKIKIDKVEGEEKEKITFSDVLMLEKGNKLEIGAPKVKGAKVEAEIIRQGRYKKVITVKFKAKKRERKVKGHRQHFTEILIKKISS